MASCFSPCAGDRGTMDANGRYFPDDSGDIMRMDTEEIVQKLEVAEAKKRAKKKARRIQEKQDERQQLQEPHRQSSSRSFPSRLASPQSPKTTDSPQSSPHHGKVVGGGSTIVTQLTNKSNRSSKSRGSKASGTSLLTKLKKIVSGDFEQLNIEDVEAIHHLRTHAELQFSAHSLASRYYRARYLWFTVLPLLLITLGCAILLVLTQAKVIADPMTVSHMHGAVIGALVICIVIQLLGTYNQYGTRAAMHSHAASQLRKLQASMRRRVLSPDFHETASRDILKYDGKIQATMKSCASPVPGPISSQFDLLAGQVALKVKLNHIEDTPLIYNKIMLGKAREVSLRIGGSFLFPWVIANVAESVVKGGSEMPWESKEIEYSTVGDHNDDDTW